MNLIRHLKLMALCAAAALLTAPATASRHIKRPLFPICAYGRIILTPFPGDEDKDAPKQNGACHAARLNERVRLVQAHRAGR